MMRIFPSDRLLVLCVLVRAWGGRETKGGGSGLTLRIGILGFALWDGRRVSLVREEGRIDRAAECQ